jgi:hypothetical protein
MGGGTEDGPFSNGPYQTSCLRVRAGRAQQPHPGGISHTRAVVSWLPVTAHFPFGLNATLTT